MARATSPSTVGEPDSAYNRAVERGLREAGERSAT